MNGIKRGLGWGALVCCLLLAPAWAQNRLHGTAGETQAVREMGERLKKALSGGDLAACRREGENMARYGQAELGRAQIDADAAAVELRIREVGVVYDQLRQIRDANAQQAVEKSYALIRAVAVKLTSDAVTEVTVTLVSAPVPGVGKVVVEMGKQSSDFLGNFNDAHQLTNRVRALQKLNEMARYAEGQMKSLQPALREAEAVRGKLYECRKQYQAGASAVQPGSPAAGGLDQLSKEQQDNLLYCACRCSTGCAATSGYSTKGFDASPSCNNPASGPCFCQGFGCLRDALKAECVQSCLPEVGVKVSVAAVKSWTDQKNRAVGVREVGTALPSPVRPEALPKPAAAGSNLAQGKPATASSRSQWSTPDDAQGAVDGVKNGRFGFHTGQQPNPWWQVDLGKAQSLAEVRLFNRLDCCAERARTVQVMLSDDGSHWRTVYRHNGGVFGGIDGKPLKVALNGETARYLRLQLNENIWFHLDEVEISPAAAQKPVQAAATAAKTCASPQRLSDNWNTAACGTTNRAAFDLDQSFTVVRLELWSDKNRAGGSLSGQLTGPKGSPVLKAKRGGCQGNWCGEHFDINQTLPPGHYRFETSAHSLCQNAGSAGQAFVRVMGCRP